MATTNHTSHTCPYGCEQFQDEDSRCDSCNARFASARASFQSSLRNIERTLGVLDCPVCGLSVTVADRIPTHHTPDVGDECVASRTWARVR